MEIKKEVLAIIIVFFLVVPFVSANFLDFFKGGMETITGRDTLTVTISVGNNAPNISQVEFDKQTAAPSEGGLRNFEISFLADDPEGSGNLDNSTARVNISLSGTAYISSNTSCTNEWVSAGDMIRYNCTVQMDYYWDDSSSWSIEAEVADSNDNYIQNSTSTCTYSALTAENLSSSSLSFPAVVPGQSNISSTTTMTVENTGNRATLHITAKMIDLAGASGKYIPAGNFSLFNSTTGTTECDSTNISAPTTPGVLPLIGINDTTIYPITTALARGAGSNENLYYCLYDVPLDLQSETYDTTAGGSWSIVVSTT